MKKAFLFVVICFILFLYFDIGLPQAQNKGLPQKLSRGHFIIYHDNEELADKFSWRLEYYYNRILRHFGVVNFRPWEGKDKCLVYLFKTKNDYVKSSGCQEWSRACAHPYPPFSLSTYEGTVTTQKLLEGTLPHELTHLLFHKLMGKQKIPLWLNEGLAQYEEKDTKKRFERKKFIKKALREGEYIKLEQLFEMRNYPEDERENWLFYCQSESIVTYLKEEYLPSFFTKFLIYTKKGKSADDILKHVYQKEFPQGTEDLERKWKKYTELKY